MLPPSPAAGVPKAPPVEAPREGVPNPLVRLELPKPVVVPSPVVPKAPVLRGDPNAAAPVRFAPPRPVPNGLVRELAPVVPKVPVKPVGFV